ncbi:uncharacterized protein [Diadema setosum]|uniref:uncharacterized protein isoform X2 n=1 Tax=Diadema setosum TaxID=31175 RepID=UPI003B3BB0F1
MSTSVEITALGNKREVNSNIEINDSGITLNASLLEEPNGAVANDDKRMSRAQDQNACSKGGTVISNACDRSNDGNVGELHCVNGETGEIKMAVDGNKVGDGDAISVNGKGGLKVKDSPASVDGCGTPMSGDEWPVCNDSNVVKLNSPALPLEVERTAGQDGGETDSVGSGKSPKKKKGLLSGGLHIHMPRLSSRLSFGSDASMSSTGSDADKSPEKKKKKKDKVKRNKNKQQVGNPEYGDSTKATPNENTESYVTEQGEDMSGKDAGSVESRAENENAAELEVPQAPHDAASQSSLDQDMRVKSGKEELAEDATENAPPTVQEPDPTTPCPDQQDAADVTDGTVEDEGQQQSVCTTASVGEEEKEKDGEVAAAQLGKEQMSTPVADEGGDAGTGETGGAALQEQGSTVPETEVKQNRPADEAAQATAVPSPGVPGEQVQSPPQLPKEPAESSETKPDQMTADAAMSPEKAPDENKVKEEGEEEGKLGTLTSGDEAEDEELTVEEDQRKRKKKKGILNVHFPHFGAKKPKSEKSIDQSSDSDHNLSPKRFGWRKRKDAKSPDRREKTTDRNQRTNAGNAGTTSDQPESTAEEPEGQDVGANTGPVGTPSEELKLDVAVAALPSEDGHQPAEGSTVGGDGDGVRPEEKLLEECQAIVKETDKAADGGGNEPEDFASTDALLEQIAETITAIEEAQTLRASQAMDVNVLAEPVPGAGDSPPEQKAEPEGLDLHADVPVQVDEPGITLPSAQITLAVPSEATLVEVAEEERSETQAVQSQTNGVPDEPNNSEAGTASGPETQGDAAGGAVTPGKEKSSRFRGKLHLPKFSLPKVNLSGKKDKKKSESGKVKDAETVPSITANGNDGQDKQTCAPSGADPKDLNLEVALAAEIGSDVKAEVDTPSVQQTREVNFNEADNSNVSPPVSVPADGLCEENVPDVNDVPGENHLPVVAGKEDATTDEAVAGPVVNGTVVDTPVTNQVIDVKADINDKGEHCRVPNDPQIDTALSVDTVQVNAGVENVEVPAVDTDIPQDDMNTATESVEVPEDSEGLGKLAVSVDASKIIQESVDVKDSIECSADDDIPQGDKIDSPPISVDVAGAVQENQEVVVVMNEGFSEEEEADQKPMQDAKNKSKKGRFKMPSLNFHLPKFGGAKKVYTVGTEEKDDGHIGKVEPILNQVNALDGSARNIQLEVERKDSEAEGNGLEGKIDVEVNAGGGDISVEPEDGLVVPDVKIEAEQEKKAESPLVETSIAGASVTTDIRGPSVADLPDVATPAVEVPATDVTNKAEISGKLEFTAPEPEEPEVPSTDVCVDQVENKDLVPDVQDVDINTETSNISGAAEEFQTPVVDQEASIKAKRKGLSLPTMRFHRPKMSGMKMGKHPRYKSKTEGGKPLSASGKVTTSLPDVAISSSSDIAVSEDDIRPRRASDAADAEFMARMTAEQENAGGEGQVSPSKGKKKRFKLPRPHFSLPRFSSWLSPTRSRNAEVPEPEMTELKASPDPAVGVTAEVDIPKTNLDVVMPEVSDSQEQAADIVVQGAVDDVAGESTDAKMTGPLNVDENGLVAQIGELQEPTFTLEPVVHEIQVEVKPDISEASLPVPNIDDYTPKAEMNTRDLEITPVNIATETPKLPSFTAEIQEPSNAANISPEKSTSEVECATASAAISCDNEIPEAGGEIGVTGMELSETPDVTTGAKKKKSMMKGLMPKFQLPKLNVKMTPGKSRGKGKKGAADNVSAEESKPKLDVDTKGDTVVDVSRAAIGGSIGVDCDIPVDNVIAHSVSSEQCVENVSSEKEVTGDNVDENVSAMVMKSEDDVKLPSINKDMTEVQLTSPDKLSEPKAAAEIAITAPAEPSLPEETSVSAPDIKAAAVLPNSNDENDSDSLLPAVGTVLICYETASGPGYCDVEVPPRNLDEHVKEGMDASPQVPNVEAKSVSSDHSGAVDGGTAMDVTVGTDGGVLVENEEPSDQKQTQKKKKRKGLHMPSINMPKFSLKRFSPDKKGVSGDIKVEGSLPNVTVGGDSDVLPTQSDVSAALVDAPDSKLETDMDVVDESNTDISPKLPSQSVDIDEKAASAMDDKPSVDIAATSVESPLVKLNVDEQRATTASCENISPVSLEAGMEINGPDFSVKSNMEDITLKSEAPEAHQDMVCPVVDSTTEAAVPSVTPAETLPDAEPLNCPPIGQVIISGDPVSSSPPEVEIPEITYEAPKSPESSTSKPPKGKRSRMPQLNLPKMNFKFSSHKSDARHPSSEDVAATEDMLSPDEIERIEASLPAGQAQLTVPKLEVNGASIDNELDESPSKKGKYKKKIGGKLKKMRSRGKGKSAAAEDVKGEGLAVGATGGMQSNADIVPKLETEVVAEPCSKGEPEEIGELENGLLPDQSSDVGTLVTPEGDSPHFKVNADLITSTPIKPASSTDARFCKNNSAQMPSQSTTPQSMDVDCAVAIDSLQTTPEAVSPIARDSSFGVVVAIDFGTTFSGYAYSLVQEPESVHIMRKWEGGDPGVTNMKTPTTLLLTPEGNFHSFGFTARDFYHDMDHNEALRWLYFDKFKLTLHGDPNLNLQTEITAANGQKFSALSVFEHSLRFFREHALEELCDQSDDGQVDSNQIRWVLTVPAIWKQPAKQFMRQAAYKAGLASPSRPDQLLIALEPEAASIYIRKLRLRELAPEHQSQRQKWLRSSVGNIAKSNSQVSEKIRHGTRYMVVDCGGGTVDITVHEVEEGPGTLKELHKAAGGMHGSVNVDQEFEQLLVNIFGSTFIEEFKVKRPAGWVDLMIAFEARKRNASPWKNNPLNVSLPFSFIDYYKKFTKSKTVEEAIRSYNDADVKWSSQGMMRFTPEGMQRLFAPTLASITAGVEEVLHSPSLQGISYLFVVGGFAQSALLQTAMRKKFSNDLRIIIPRDLGLSILKGAVQFGLDPSAVRVRRSRLTYGVGVLNKFQPGKHPEEKKVTKDNMDWCKDIFDTFVQSDQSVAVGDKVTRSYTPAKPSQQEIIINIYCSDRENVRFITDAGVRKCGTLHIDVSDSQCSPSLQGRRELQLTMQYGDTEIKVSALDVPTGKCVKSSIDFLNK